MWVCPDCRGRLVPMAALERLAPFEFVERLRLSFSDSIGRNGPACPACRRATRVATSSIAGLVVDLDLCRRCRLIWFDPGELQHLPRKPRYAQPAQAGVVERAQRALAIEQVRSETALSRAAIESGSVDVPPAKLVFAFLGLPVEVGGLRVASAGFWPAVACSGDG